MKMSEKCTKHLLKYLQWIFRAFHFGFKNESIPPKIIFSYATVRMSEQFTHILSLLCIDKFMTTQKINFFFIHVIDNNGNGILNKHASQPYGVFTIAQNLNNDMNGYRD